MPNDSQQDQLINEHVLTHVDGEEADGSAAAPTVYSIMCGKDDSEYYTVCPPTIMTNGDSLVASAIDVFIKKSVKQQVLGEDVEVYFKSEIVSVEIQFLLSDGVLLKEYLAAELDWLDKTIEQAESEIKDMVILKYNQIVPNLVNQLNTLQSQMQQSKQRKQQTNEDLIRL